MRPLNVVSILADDLGSWALGCAGNSEVRTPSLDRIADAGMRFSNAFCVSPVCSPARASLLTGRIPSQHGVHDWIRRGNSPGESPDGAVIDYLSGQPTLTEILAGDGYDCGISGKWHLGNVLTPQKGNRFWKVHARGGGPYYHAPMIDDRGKEYVEPRYVTDVITGHAEDFLRQQIGKDEPFHLSVHYTAPHSPWSRDQHPAEFYDPYYDGCPFESVPDLPMHPWQIDTAPCAVNPESRRELLSGYYASISAMDAGIGRLLEFLDLNGLADDTLFVFTSDNGMNMGHHGIYGKGNGTFPQNMYDTSVKVPFLVSCPGKIPAGSTCDALFSHYDYLPTLLGFLGLENRIPPALPGQALHDLWLGHTRANREEVVVFDEYGPVQMLRTLTWKYVHRYPAGPHELDDLQNDPGEGENLADSPEHERIRDDLRRRLEAWFARFVDPCLDGRMHLVTGKGQLDRVDAGADKPFEDDWFYLNDRAVAPAAPKGGVS